MKLMKLAAYVFAPLVVFSFAQAQDLPAGPGKETLEKVCTTCHGLEAVVTVQGNKDTWQSVIDDMKSRGADASDADFTAIVNYLSMYFGTPVNVNTAASKDLADNLGLTASEADAIVKYRTDKGKFTQYSDLAKVPGLDMKKLDPIQKRIKF
jgi:competence ComEA-like helix-hairpin-helix protein